MANSAYQQKLRTVWWAILASLPALAAAQECTAPTRGNSLNGFDQQCRVFEKVCVDGKCVPEAMGILCFDSSDCCGSPTMPCKAFCNFNKPNGPTRCVPKHDIGGECTLNEECISGYCMTNMQANGFFPSCQKPGALTPEVQQPRPASTTSTASTTTSSSPPLATPAAVTTTTTVSINHPAITTSTDTPPSSTSSKVSSSTPTQVQSAASTDDKPPFTSTSTFTGLISVLMILLLICLAIFFYRRRRHRLRAERNARIENVDVSKPTAVNPLYDQYVGSNDELIDHMSEKGDLSMGAQALLNPAPSTVNRLSTIIPPMSHGDAAVLQNTDTDGLILKLREYEASARFYPRQSNELLLTPGTAITCLAKYSDGWAYGVNLVTEQTGFFPLSSVKPQQSNSVPSGSLESWQ